MTKKVFLSKLRRQICKLPSKEINERISFYSEIIDDKIEEGLTEEEAVADVGDVMQIADQILSDSNIGLKEKRTKKPVSAWQIALLVIGSPVWFSILLTVFAVMWSLLITVFAVAIPFVIMGFIGKYMWIVCIEFAKLSIILTRKCANAIGELFGR